MPLSIKELLEPKPTPKEQAILDFLNNDKSGELFSANDILTRTRICQTVLSKMRRGPALKSYTVAVGNKHWYAKPSVIAEFKKAAGKVPQ